MQTVDVWLTYRNKDAAHEVSRGRKPYIPQGPSPPAPGGTREARLPKPPLKLELSITSKAVDQIIPEPVLDLMTERVQKCWDYYQSVLSGDYLPPQVDRATNQLKFCLCQELRRIRELNALKLPTPVLDKWWEAYCGVENQSAPPSA